MRYFLTGRLPAITRVLLIESGRREILERLIPALRRIWGDAVQLDKVPATTPKKPGSVAGAVTNSVTKAPVKSATVTKTRRSSRVPLNSLSRQPVQCHSKFLEPDSQFPPFVTAQTGDLRQQRHYGFVGFLGLYVER